MLCRGYSVWGANLGRVVHFSKGVELLWGGGFCAGMFPPREYVKFLKREGERKRAWLSPLKISDTKKYIYKASF